MSDLPPRDPTSSDPHPWDPPIMDDRDADCRATAELLEVIRPDSADLDDPALSAAAAHLRHCGRCSETHTRLTAWDRSLAERLQDVPVPTGLRDRLLSRLAEAEGPAPVVVRPVRSRRRMLLGLGAVVAAALVLALALPWLPKSAPRLTPAAAVAIVTQPDFTSAGDELAAGATIVWPESMYRPRELANAPRRALMLNGRVVGTIVQSVVAGPRNSATIVLCAIQLDQLRREPQDVPPARAFNAAAVEYVHGVAVKTWEEGNVLFVCYARGKSGREVLESLRLPLVSA